MFNEYVCFHDQILILVKDGIQDVCYLLFT